MTERYENILKHRHHVSEGRGRMSAHDRAAQFAPYAALSGYDGCVREEARVTEKRIILDESEIERLDGAISALARHIGEYEVAVTFFVPDMRKPGGSYVTVTGRVLAVDADRHLLSMANGRDIPFEEIIRIEGDFL